MTTTATTVTDDAETYMASIMGQKSVLELVATDQELSSSADDDIVTQHLLRVDSLWNLGRASEGTEALNGIKAAGQNVLSKPNSSFLNGLEALLNNQPLSSAFSEFQNAASEATGLLKVFFTERAVNVAFWMACAGKMLESANLVNGQKESLEYAGGILSFAVHMTGDSIKAEQIARAAIEKGYADPWTLHAVAHALYSQGRSQECIDWIIEHRVAMKDCSAFMKGHMEFHLALCLIDVEGSMELTQFIRGDLWGGMADDMKQDYWNQVGLLNILWKAELRGLVIDADEAREQVMSKLRDADTGKSSVFSLCMLRWSTGSVRDKWKRALSESDNDTLVAVAKAVDMIYYVEDRNDAVVVETVWQEAAQILSPFVDNLKSLGASPEQREVIEEFVAIVAVKSGGSIIDTEKWNARNRRPNVPFYDLICP